jgi:hypothetical protein
MLIIWKTFTQILIYTCIIHFKYSIVILIHYMKIGGVHMDNISPVGLYAKTLQRVNDRIGHIITELEILNKCIKDREDDDAFFYELAKEFEKISEDDSEIFDLRAHCTMLNGYYKVIDRMNNEAKNSSAE